MPRIAVVSHSHPSITSGGGEVAAHRWFEYLQAKGHDAVFAGLTYNPEPIRELFGETDRPIVMGPGDFCLDGHGMDSFKMEHANVDDEDRVLDFLLSLNADIYHFHHFWVIGAAVIRRLRQLRPEVTLICTLHDFNAICANHGQMIKAGSNDLCYKASPLDCARCLSDRQPLDFIIRRHRMIEMLEDFDHLISPSEFLRTRFEEWGTPKGRISVIENGMDIAPIDTSETPETLANKSTKFAYFGNATPTKGLDVLIMAAGVLAAKEDAPAVTVDVHGCTLDRFTALYPDIEVPPFVRFRGRYKPADAVPLMRRYGWVVMPSIWWENSPVIIQEAKAAQTPMVATDIGGVFEKSAHMGRHFGTADSIGLAALIAELANDVAALEHFKARIDQPFGLDQFFSEWTEATGVDLGIDIPDPVIELTR